MPAQIWDDAVALSTAPIFDDAIYLSEALNLPVNQNEDNLDAELALSARESGIQDPYRFLCPPQDISRALSTLTMDSDHRSSMSIHSQETQSTSFTSAPSRTSRDQIYSTERSLAQRALPKFARTSVSVGDYDHAMESPAPSIQQRHSISTPSVAQSALFSSSSLQTHPPRRKRGSGLFAMFRKDSRYGYKLVPMSSHTNTVPSTCASRSHHGHSSRSRGDKLECGHSLSTFAVRIHVQEALQIGGDTVPNCCGKALPRTLIESVLSQQETDLILNGALRDANYSEDSVSLTDLTHPLENTSLPATNSVASHIPAQRARYEAINIDSALANEAFKSFKAQQKEQFERVSAFECNQRNALSAHHQSSLKRLEAQYEANRKEKMEQVGLVRTSRLMSAYLHPAAYLRHGPPGRTADRCRTRPPQSTGARYSECCNSAEAYGGLLSGHQRQPSRTCAYC